MGSLASGDAAAKADVSFTHPQLGTKTSRVLRMRGKVSMKKNNIDRFNQMLLCTNVGAQRCVHIGAKAESAAERGWCSKRCAEGQTASKVQAERECKVAGMLPK